MREYRFRFLCKEAQKIDSLPSLPTPACYMLPLSPRRPAACRTGRRGMTWAGKGRGGEMQARERWVEMIHRRVQKRHREGVGV